MLQRILIGIVVCILTLGGISFAFEPNEEERNELAELKGQLNQITE